MSERELPASEDWRRIIDERPIEAFEKWRIVTDIMTANGLLDKEAPLGVSRFISFVTTIINTLTSCDDIPEYKGLRRSNEPKVISALQRLVGRLTLYPAGAAIDLDVLLAFDRVFVPYGAWANNKSAKAYGEILDLIDPWGRWSFEEDFSSQIASIVDAMVCVTSISGEQATQTRNRRIAEILASTREFPPAPKPPKPKFPS